MGGGEGVKGWGGEEGVKGWGREEGVKGWEEERGVSPGPGGVCTARGMKACAFFSPRRLAPATASVLAMMELKSATCTQLQPSAWSPMPQSRMGMESTTLMVTRAKAKTMEGTMICVRFRRCRGFRAEGGRGDLSDAEPSTVTSSMPSSSRRVAFTCVQLHACDPPSLPHLLEDEVVDPQCAV